jgi:hypothetical protein
MPITKRVSIDEMNLSASTPLPVTLASGANIDIGTKADAAVIDPTLPASVIAELKGLLKQLQNTGTAGTYAPVSLATPISSEYDSINISKMSKGGITVAHNAIVATATSVEIDCRGFNTISVEMACSAFSSGNWNAAIHGCAVSGGTFGACFLPQDAGTHIAMTTGALSTNGNYTFYFKGIPNYVKIVATRTTDGTLTCTVTPMNL